MHFACQLIPLGKQGISRPTGSATGVEDVAVMRSGVDNPTPDRLIAARKSAVEGSLSRQMNGNAHLDQQNDLFYVDRSPS
jgi:hypothetical protein